ncbi:MAG: T9SS type A sorting domain-containing protein [Ignavibacteriae bacterium]|nr:T9SS C-terminal target domain-containing protein [Ignavibacteriota bacterium]NOG97020.1 T9SS type A sorting domain-containing protein [Ignavibacteriota bacterium]
MKKYLLLLLILAAAQKTIPQENYYTQTDGLYGDQLENRLHQIIRNHVRYPYTSSAGTDVWDILKQTDKDTSNPSNVILIYSGWSINADAEYNNGSGWSREHIWPKSHGFPGSGDTAYTDAHHLRPCDITVNSRRSDKDYDNGGEQVIDDDGATNCYTDSDSWEPRDEVKGDCARMIFYMAARYGNIDSEGLEIVDYTGTLSGTPLIGKLSTLLSWNRFDPPDDFERNRNNVVFAFQNNRNPFVDCPEFADRIYCANGLVVENVQVISQNQIVVKFNSNLEASSAENTANYFIDQSVGTPLLAELGYLGDHSSVLLTVNPLSTNKNYIVKFSNILSASGSRIFDNSISALNITSSFPVELMSFTAEIFQNVVKLKWSTATEINNYGFKIQRSVDEEVWNNVGFVSGNGTTNAPKDYSFVDTKLSNSSSCYYRLKQVDNDGSYEYSKTIEVVLETPTEYELGQNYPNPFNPSTLISFTLPEAGYTSLIVYNSLGQEVAALVNNQLEAGSHQYNFDAKNLTSGIYFYKLELNDFIQVRKMMLLK